MTIVILFQASGFRNFKTYCTQQSGTRPKKFGVYLVSIFVERYRE